MNFSNHMLCDEHFEKEKHKTSPLFQSLYLHIKDTSPYYTGWNTQAMSFCNLKP